MADRLDVTVLGMKDLKENVKRLAAGLPPSRVEALLLKGAQMVAADMKARVPYDPRRDPGKLEHGWPHLRDAIVTKTLVRLLNDPAPAIAAVDRKLAPHAHLVEFGSHGKVRVGAKGDRRYIGREFGVMPAQPFMRPAWREMKEPVMQMLLTSLLEMVEGSVRAV